MGIVGRKLLLSGFGLQQLGGVGLADPVAQNIIGTQAAGAAWVIGV
ncbi:hypothetical protein [Nodosilinea sp. E11]|nr:hypothetical protein [Nodosilinea sp. E11]WOD40208.1 hypothetical protein RRF56_05310 [Nodosilinea sp. E11]